MIVCGLGLSFIFIFPLLLGFASSPFHNFIKRGRYIRDLSDNTYFGRAAYGRLWTSLFYSGPIYQIFLGIRPFRNLVLRLFGMKGELDFTVFPDTWIRDLPILEIGKGSYMANKSTIGTNICLKDNVTLVDRVRFAPRAMVGHMAVIGPGCKLGENSELGVSATLGIRVTIGGDSNIGALAAINHGSVVGSKVNIGTRAYIGVRVQISNDVTIPPNTVVPDGNIVMSNTDLLRVISKSQTEISLAIEEAKNVILKHGTND